MNECHHGERTLQLKNREYRLQCAGAIWDIGGLVGFTMERAKCETGKGLEVSS